MIALWRTLFAIAVAGVIVVSLLPQRSVEGAALLPDYLSHAIGYAVLGALAMLATNAGAPWRWAIALTALGIVLELLQPVIADRVASLADVIANGLGAFFGVALITMYRNRRR